MAYGDVSFNNIDGVYVTYNIPPAVDENELVYEPTVAGGSSHVGKAVTLYDWKTVGLTTGDNPVLGKLISVESDGKCSVQTGGYVELPWGGGQAILGQGVIGEANGAVKSVYPTHTNLETVRRALIRQGRLVDVNLDTDLCIVIL